MIVLLLLFSFIAILFSFSFVFFVLLDRWLVWFSIFWIIFPSSVNFVLLTNFCEFELTVSILCYSNNVWMCWSTYLFLAAIECNPRTMFCVSVNILSVLIVRIGGDNVTGLSRIIHNLPIIEWNIIHPLDPVFSDSFSPRFINRTACYLY